MPPLRVHAAHARTRYMLHTAMIFEPRPGSRCAGSRTRAPPPPFRQIMRPCNSVRHAAAFFMRLPGENCSLHPVPHSFELQHRMASRRGAVKINPVTGKLEKVEAKNADGTNTHRDGCMVVDDRYINAAKELGLGADEGAFDCGCDPLRADKNRDENAFAGKKRSPSFFASVLTQSSSIFTFDSQACTPTSSRWSAWALLTSPLAPAWRERASKRVSTAEVAARAARPNGALRRPGSHLHLAAFARAL
jgi:hypothetical protein